MSCLPFGAPKHFLDAQVRSFGCLVKRARGTQLVDAWGFDPEIHAALVSLGRAMWDIEVDGLGHIPESGPAVLAVQRGTGLSELAVTSVAVAATGRRTRLMGIPDAEILEMPFRLAGRVMNNPAEMRGLLRDGHVVAVPMARSIRGGSPGSLDPLVLAPAVDLGVPVLPVAVRGSYLNRKWHVEIARPVPAPAETGRLGGIEMAGRAREAVGAIAAARGN